MLSGAVPAARTPTAGADRRLVLALDPQAPAAVRTLVGADSSGGGRLPQRHGDPHGPRRALSQLAGAVVTVTVLQVLEPLLPQAPVDHDPGRRLLRQALGAAHWAAWGTAGLLVAVALGNALAEVLSRRRDLAQQRAVTAALPYLVVQGEVDPAGERLLARARAAAATVLGSELHAADLLDRQRGNTVVPAEVWAIATALRDRARLTARPPAQVRDRDRSAHRAQQLAQAGAAVLARVVALEGYARAVRRAEAGYRRWQSAQGPVEASAAQQADEDAVLDLLAASAGHQVQARELESMTSRAEELAQVLEPDAGHVPGGGPAL